MTPHLPGRQIVKLTCIAIVVLLILIRIPYISSVPNAFRSGNAYLCRFGVKQGLKQHHVFIPANHIHITYSGRWYKNPLETPRYASFKGSQLSFTACNTTSILVSVGNRVGSHHDSFKGANSVSILEVTPIERPQYSSPASMLVNIDEQAFLFNNTAYDVMRLAKDLDLTWCHDVEMKTLSGDWLQDTSIQFEGIWLSKGGYLRSRDQKSGRKDEDTRRLFETKQPSPTASTHTRDKIDTRELLEVFSCITGLVTRSGFTKSASETSLLAPSFAELLQDIASKDIEVASINIPPRLCLTVRCSTLDRHKSTISNPTVQDLYFRSGPQFTAGYRRPWSYSNTSIPRAIVLEIGFYDFQAFLSSPEHHNNATIASFSAHFVEEFVKFVLTIRRNLPHRIPYHLKKDNEEYRDHSYLYNSQPSTQPIFLMIPPLPSDYDRTLSIALFNAISQVVNRLQGIEGDKMTQLIDTTGWLANTDFTTIAFDTATRENSNSRQSASLKARNSHPPTDQAANQKPQLTIPIPTTLGHAKIAYFLSLHLCPYLPSQQLKSNSSLRTSHTCPFNRQSRYSGNLYVPDETTIGKILEERKIERVKALLFPGKFQTS